MPHFRHFRHLASALLAAATTLTLVACGGGGGAADDPVASGPAPVQVDTTRTALATLDAAGGSVTATAADGRRYTLTVPAGALAAATEITATPVVSMGDAPLADGLKAAVRFGPSGLRFALPATLRIEGASRTTRAGARLVGFLRSQDGSSMQLVPPDLEGDAIELAVGHFSDVGVSDATAQELEAVPRDANAAPDEALLDEYLRDLPVDQDQAAEVALLVRLHDTRLALRLTAAESRAPGSDPERAMLVRLAHTWLGMVELTFPSNTETALNPDFVPGPLLSLVNAVRQRVLQMLNADFEAGRTACMAPAPVGSAQFAGLQTALLALNRIDGFGDLGGLPGEDVDAALLRLNDCVRVAFDPIPLPTFEMNRPVSLDLRMRLIFAADPNASVPVPFEVSVVSLDVIEGGDIGFSDALGNFTLVVTPFEANPAFDVAACMALTLEGGGPVTSRLCSRQNLGGEPDDVVLAGEVVFFATSFGRPVAEIGSVRLRLRAEPDDRFTVLEATGSTRRTITSTTECFPFPSDGLGGRNVTTTSTTTATITGGQQNDFLNAGRFIGFTLTGSTVIVEDRLQPDCSVVQQTTTFTNAGGFQILEIQRDAQGQPVVLVIGDSAGSQEGRLVRE